MTINLEFITIRLGYHTYWRSTRWKIKTGRKGVFDRISSAWESWLRKRHQILLMSWRSIHDSGWETNSRWWKIRQNPSQRTTKTRERSQSFQTSNWHWTMCHWKRPKTWRKTQLGHLQEQSLCTLKVMYWHLLEINDLIDHQAMIR